jgi:hypothetical protein
MLAQPEQCFAEPKNAEPYIVSENELESRLIDNLQIHYIPEIIIQ